MIDHDLIRARELKPPKGRGFWVFAYGSLMWRPGFDFLESRPALLRGYHRAFCIVSTHYRGTPKKPGLVLGLDRGGACRGRAYRIAASKAKNVARYLHEREMVGAVYEPRWLSVTTPGGQVRAVAYVADRDNPQYVGKLSLKRAAERIRNSAGVSGTNRDYLAQTVRHLDDLGIADGPLHRLLRLVEGKRRARGMRDQRN
jgi:glutathione-specific gamma-glutamylcyclotransferase